MKRISLATIITAAALGLAAAPATAAPLHILVTNDDGFGAEGISKLVEGLRTQPDVRVSVVAPKEDQSGKGILTSGHPSTLTVNPNARTMDDYPAIAVDGYPADSVNYALYYFNLTGQPRPNLVISGTNEGSNPGPLGTTFSGTIGAALTASWAGLPALASSQSLGSPPDYASGVKYTVNWVNANRGSLKTGFVANLNVPTCKSGTRIAGQLNTDSWRFGNPLNILALRSPINCRRSYFPWLLKSDVDALAHGYVTLSKIPTF